MHSFLLISSPVRIAVLHEVANLDPSGWAGSTPALGVKIFKHKKLQYQIRDGK